jgi:hypothetical protein
MPPTVTHAEAHTKPNLTQESFDALVAEWTSATGPISSSTEIRAHPAFRQIVAAGNEAVPFILRKIKAEPSLLMLALFEITGENPVPPEANGIIREMGKAWVAWGEKSGALR